MYIKDDLRYSILFQTFKGGVVGLCMENSLQSFVGLPLDTYKCTQPDNIQITYHRGMEG